MNDEIKEILELHIKNEIDLLPKNQKKVLDYITNLQEELEEQKRIEQADFKTIQSLEEENERLKIQLNNADNKNLELIEELNKEIDRYEDTISFELGYDKGSKEYKSRIYKATEYIKNHTIEWVDEQFEVYNVMVKVDEYFNPEHAIWLLNGGDENDN